MSWLRSLTFNIAFFALTALLGIAALPLLAAPRRCVMRFGRFWAQSVLDLLKAIVGLDGEVRGIGHLPRGAVLIAMKHQSMWDTLMLPPLLGDPAVVVKRELLFVPIYGWYACRAGSIFVGTQGVLVLPHIARAILYPDKKYKDLKFPDVKEDSHWSLFVDACLGGARTTAGFDYSGPLAEAVLAGTVALRFPQTTLHWNAPTLSFAETIANGYIRRAYRPGWTVKGL